jgi:hypothetical protein
MRKYVLCSALLVLLVGGDFGTGAPLDPKVRGGRAVSLEGYGQQTYWRKFDGGRTAKFIVMGLEFGFVGLYVFDPHGNCIAHDDEVSSRTPNELAVAWTPPRTDTYTIEVKALGRLANHFDFGVHQDPGS